MTDFIEKYAQSLTSQYMSIKDTPEIKKQLNYIISPLCVELPENVYTLAQKAIKEIYNYAQSSDFIDGLEERVSLEELEILQLSVKNNSVLMAYDFHYDAKKNQLSLIEINTNAAAFLFAAELYKIFSDNQNPWGDPLANLRHSFENELRLAGFKGKPRIAIIDENIDQQKMRLEFLLYDHLFKSWGWQSSISEMNSLKLEYVDFVYNRYTDFLFSAATSRKLRNAYISGKVIFSPHPREYLLLAAKERLIEFYTANISAVLIPTQELKINSDIENIWADKKKLIFKPKRSYGGKGVYKGHSISRKKFDEILTDEYLAQEFRPPGTIGEWKYDLRFYAYQNEIQLGAARLYIGQVTNFSTPGGGLARIKFI